MLVEELIDPCMDALEDLQVETSPLCCKDAAIFLAQSCFEEIESDASDETSESLSAKARLVFERP